MKDQSPQNYIDTKKKALKNLTHNNQTIVQNTHVIISLTIINLNPIDMQSHQPDVINSVGRFLVVRLDSYRLVYDRA